MITVTVASLLSALAAACALLAGRFAGRRAARRGAGVEAGGEAGAGGGRGRGALWLCWRVVQAGGYVVAPIALLLSVVLLWYGHRPQPEPLRRELFVGVRYQREVRRTPRPLVIHRVRVDLRAAGVGVLVTPPASAGRRPLRGATTSAFLRRHRLQLAVNGQVFRPWHSATPWDYYPRVGDPVAVSGLNASRGRVYSRSRRRWATLFVSRQNRASVGEPRGVIYNAISGQSRLLHGGRLAQRLRRQRRLNGRLVLAPRTAAGVDRRGRLLLVVVDGRQPGYSEGMTMRELALLMLGIGARDAINLDGGGSSVLVVQSDGGEPRVLSSPINGRIPGRERVVANHIGIFARRLSRASSAGSARLRRKAARAARTPRVTTPPP